MRPEKQIDFTRDVLTSPNHIGFNPSIAHWKDDLYLCCIREFVRYPTLHQENKYDADPFNNPNHPWLLMNHTKRWVGQHPYGNDTTTLSLLKINRNDYTISQTVKYNENNTYWETGGMRTQTPEPPEKLGVDTRIIKIREDTFVLIYNKFISKDASIVVKYGYNCSTWCGLLAVRFIYMLHPNINNDILIGQETILCPEISNQVEKNWSLWLERNSTHMYFSYGITPRHTVYKLKLSKDDNNNEKLECDGSVAILEQHENFYTKLENKINREYGPDTFHVSVSAPAIYLPSINQYLGVGHIKFKYQNILKVFSFFGKNIYRISTDAVNPDKNYINHSTYLYFAYFYTFDKTPDITSGSDFFLFGNSTIGNTVTRLTPVIKTFTLDFVSGLTLTQNNDVLVSYGNGDSGCRYTIFTQQEIFDLLKHKVGPVPIDPDSIDYLTSPPY